MTAMPTADICDAHPEVEVLEPGFINFGGVDHFSGKAVTIKCFEDNSRVNEVLEKAGEDRVLVIDAGGSMRCAVLGDRLARLAEKNGWAGIIVYGCIRDSAEIADIPIGVQAVATHPRRSDKRGEGEVDTTVRIAGMPIRPGNWIYADSDGIVIAPERLPLDDT